MQSTILKARSGKVSTRSKSGRGKRRYWGQNVDDVTWWRTADDIHFSCQWRSRTFGRPGRWSNLAPFRLRFLKLESQGPNVIADDSYTLAVTLCFSCTQTHMKLRLLSEFSREFFFQFSAFFAPLPPLASAARCGPHPRRYATTPAVYSYNVSEVKCDWVID